MADPTDVQHGASQINSIKVMQMISEFGHADFVWGIDTNALLYQPIIQLLNRLPPSN